MPTNIEPVVFENSKLVFRNFAGRANEYNDEGKRNFCLLLSPEEAESMRRDGWNVRTMPAKPQYDQEESHYIKVKVTFKGRPPTIVLISSRGRTNVPEDLLEVLDYIDIKNVDLIVRAYSYDVAGRQGVAAYLKSIYITVNEDRLELKYADVPEIESGPQLALEAKQAWDYEGQIVDEEFEKALGR